jgi:acetolactate synthase I/II/III large subunit
MDLTRRELLQAVSAGCALGLTDAPAIAGILHRPGWVDGHMTGAEALVETLIHEGADCVFGIPGAQQNELWDTMKTKRLGYLLVTHEFAASTMADGYARSTGKPGVICVVPGPGLTNALSGIGEALLDSIPMVCIVGDVANGARARPFQVHCLNQVALLQPVTKEVFAVERVGDIPLRVRQAFQLAAAGEPGPVAVVIPYNLLIEAQRFHSGPLEPVGVLYDGAAAERALSLLGRASLRVGIYAGQGCMNYSPELAALAEVLQAPVATSIAGKGAMTENHPLAVGWGYGPQGTVAAEMAFKNVDLVLALGVKFSEVSTGYYSLPRHRHLIHVDINSDNLGRIMPTSVCVHADAGVFLGQALACANQLRRPVNVRLVDDIRRAKAQEAGCHAQISSRCGVDPMAFLLALRRASACDALAFVDVTVSQYWATETFAVTQPRTFFNPTNNQAMGWSIPAALGAQRAFPHRQTITITGDGCFLMSAIEMSTAAREHLPVKFFVLDDQAYHYMQALQEPAYRRTTATVLARLDYRSFALAMGVGYHEIIDNDDLDPRLRGILEQPGPVLVRVVTDYGHRPVRWIKAAKDRFTSELTRDQKVRFLARIGSRALVRHPEND